jgi:hypothetical protein
MAIEPDNPRAEGSGRCGAETGEELCGVERLVVVRYVD